MYIHPQIVRVFHALLLLLILSPVVRAAASGQNQSIYTDSPQNGWQNWSWATVDLGNTAPVKAGSASIKVDAGGYAALYLHHDSFSTTPYTALTFWIHGGTSGGQSIQVQATANSGNALPPLFLAPLTASQWQQITIPLSDLGVGGITNMDGIWIKNVTGNTLPTFYVDEITLVGAAVPTTVNLFVNNLQTVRTVDARTFGVNTAVWDSAFNNQTTIDLLTASENRVLRFPGGSTSDDYHWLTNTTGTNTWQWATGFDAFANVAKKTNAQVYITANYGNGTAQEAADWVRYSNIKQGYGFKYWEVGNENYGSWEADGNSRAHDPYTYATRFQDYFSAMKAVDPTIKIGAVIITGEDDWGNYTDHPATNPRTKTAHNGWAPVLLTQLKALGVTPDFVIYHKYAQNPGNESDASLLQSSLSWQSDIDSLRQMLTDYMGATGAAIEITITENNSVSYNPGKQSTSLVNGLFMADSIGQVLQTEVNGLVWWDLRNGQEATHNNADSLYGWRQYGDYGIVSPNNDKYPVYYMTMLLRQFARGGDTVVRATSDYSLLTVYAAHRQDGTLSLLVINKSPNQTLNGNIALNGFAASNTATYYSYGIAQDEAARTNTGSPDLVSGTITGIGTSGIRRAYPPYSATVIQFAPATIPVAPSALSLSVAGGGKINLSWKDNSGNETGFKIERSTDGKSWAQIGLVGRNVTTYANTSLSVGTLYWYRLRAYNTMGNSGYSNTVQGRAR